MSGLPCTKCGGKTTVIDTRSRSFNRGNQVYRRRRCLDANCKHRFSTVELLVARVGKSQSIARTYKVLDALEKRAVLNKVNQLFRELKKVLDE